MCCSRSRRGGYQCHVGKLNGGAVPFACGAACSARTKLRPVSGSTPAGGGGVDTYGDGCEGEASCPCPNEDEEDGACNAQLALLLYRPFVPSCMNASDCAASCTAPLDAAGNLLEDVEGQRELDDPTSGSWEPLY